MNTLIENLQFITNTLWRVESKSQFQNLLEDILTPQEISEIRERIQLFGLLKKGVSQREIAKQLGISITTVNRGSRVLQWGTGAAKKLL